LIYVVYRYRVREVHVYCVIRDMPGPRCAVRGGRAAGEMRIPLIILFE
jgi:hypothetical protein